MASIHLYRVRPDASEHDLLGDISEEQLNFLIDNLEEEFEEDEDYYIDRATLDYLKDQGADEELLSLLEQAVADAPDGIELSYRIT